jgi:hypothetical protein
MRNSLIAVVMLVSLLVGGLVAAQEGRGAPDVLGYGDVVMGEISNTSFEVFYDMQGDEGDVVLLQVVSLADDNAFQWPEVVVFSDANEILADSNEFVSINQSSVALQLPYTGNYEVMVTRDDGRTGEGEGPFELRVISPQSLERGETVQDEVRNDGVLHYYAIEEPAFFGVYYEFGGGAMDPWIYIYVLGEDGELDDVAELSGVGLVNATLGLDGSASGVHILTIGDNPFASYFDNRVETTAYQLRLLNND